MMYSSSYSQRGNWLSWQRIVGSLSGWCITYGRADVLVFRPWSGWRLCLQVMVKPLSRRRPTRSGRRCIQVSLHSSYESSLSEYHFVPGEFAQLLLFLSLNVISFQVSLHSNGELPSLNPFCSRWVCTATMSSLWMAFRPKWFCTAIVNSPPPPPLNIISFRVSCAVTLSSPNIICSKWICTATLSSLPQNIISFQMSFHSGYELSLFPSVSFYPRRAWAGTRRSLLHNDLRGKALSLYIMKVIPPHHLPIHPPSLASLHSPNFISISCPRRVCHLLLVRTSFVALWSCLLHIVLSSLSEEYFASALLPYTTVPTPEYTSTAAGKSTQVDLHASWSIFRLIFVKGPDLRSYNHCYSSQTSRHLPSCYQRSPSQFI